jgi:hypothetical protein
VLMSWTFAGRTVTPAVPARSWLTWTISRRAGRYGANDGPPVYAAASVVLKSAAKLYQRVKLGGPLTGASAEG